VILQSRRRTLFGNSRPARHELETELMRGSEPPRDWNSLYGKWIRSGTVNTSATGRTTNEARVANQLKGSGVYMLLASERISKQPWGSPERIGKLSLRDLEVAANGLQIRSSHVQVRIGVIADFEARGGEVTYVVPRHPAGLARQLSIPGGNSRRAYEACRQKERGRHAKLLEDRRCNLEIVEIPIVECQGKSAAKVRAGATTRNLLRQRDDFEVSAEELAKRAEFLGATCEGVLGKLVADPMERDHDHVRAKFASVEPSGSRGAATQGFYGCSKAHYWLAPAERYKL
jgi:hypothetical protein